MKKSRFNYLVQQENVPALLFNTRNHALVELDRSTLEAYQNEALDDKTAQVMSELGFLVQDTLDEVADLEAERSKYCEFNPSMLLTIMVTDRCNFRCPYCYQPHNPKDMSPETAAILCKFLENVYEEQTQTVNIQWFGGEPLLNVEPIFRVEKLLKERGFGGYSNLTTNGFLLTDDLLDRFRHETRIDTFQITLDGTREQHNATRCHVSGKPTYETICQNISKAVSKGFSVTIRINLNKVNQSLDPLFEKLNRLNLDRSKYRVHVSNAFNFDASQNLQNFYFETAEEFGMAFSQAQDSFIKFNHSFPRNYTKKVGCEFERSNTFLVGSDLSLYFCSACEQSDFFKQGHIDDNGYLFLNENYAKRKDVSVFKDAECRNCIVLPMCMGGCAYCRIKEKKFCIPEKYFLDKYIMRLYHEAEK